MALLTSGKNVQLFGPKNFSKVNQFPKSPKAHLIIAKIIINDDNYPRNHDDDEVLPNLPDTRDGSHTVDFVNSHVILCGGGGRDYYEYDHPSFAGMVAAIIRVKLFK